MTTLLSDAELSDADLLARMVSFDTTSRYSNLPLADFICDYLDRPGVEIVRAPAPEGDKVNLVVYVGPSVGKEREGLTLSGHMDVVPAEEPGWASDPFELTDAGDRYVARGSADMKGFVALAVNRAARLAASAGDLQQPLALVLTYDEEVGTVGARHFAHSWNRPLPRHAIIGEPTELKVVRMHKGHLKLRVTLRGQSAHSGYPHLGRNAIEPAGRVIVALSELRRQLETEAPPNRQFFPEVPFVALNVAMVQGGTAVNIVPDLCTLMVGARVLPGMNSAEIATRIRQAIDQATCEEQDTAGSKIDEPEIELLNDSPPLLVSEEAPICRQLYPLSSQTETLSASYATDAGWLQKLDMDCAIWGPGSIEVAHKPNEYLPKDQFVRAGELLDGIIRERCG